MRTIRVTGKGQMKIHPDMTVITIDLEGKYPEYDETLRRSAEDTEKLKDILAAFGFERTDLKTLSFDVDTEYERYEEWHGSRKDIRQRLAGYTFRHRLKVEFGSDNYRLGKILYALANSPLQPEFRISYTVKDREAAKNELLGRSVADAAAKAAVLTGAAGVTLGEIQSVDYSWGEINFDFTPVNRMMKGAAYFEIADSSPGYAMDIEPDDVDVSDTVTVVWEIR